MNWEQLIKTLGFQPKNDTIGIYQKKYPQFSYAIEIDFSKEQIFQPKYNTVYGIKNKNTGALTYKLYYIDGG